MRPIKLIMQAFGPYAREQVLDFSVLEERSLFLIHGPTGAGKTSILDAICFALYGETSGGERQAKHMRSDHANPNLLTEVTFDFILGAETYRVFRRPEQERPKRRGGGTTKEPAKATLWKRTNVKGDEDEGIVIADRWSRVNEEMERILGFRSDQFRQVVVLPQGQFRRFLSAASQERQKILQVLFQTEFYHQIEESLKHAANEAKNRLVKLHEKRKEILKRFGVDNVEALHKKLSDVEKERGVIEERIKTLREEEILVFKKLEEAKEIIKKFGEYEEAKKELNVIEAKKEEFKEKQKRLDMAKRALSLRDVESELSNREEELIEAEKKLKKADGALKIAQKKKEKADKDVEIEDLREEERDRVRREVDRLESLRL
ncbi:MAG: SMC family ATPase, partial [Nitrospirae bacterium]